MRINRTLPQGIVTILNSDGEIKPSIRRTLSADMSSKQWLHQNGLLPRVPSPAVDSSSSSDGDEDFDRNLRRDRVWMSVNEMQKSNTWESILRGGGGGGGGGGSTPPPYVHPTVNRPAASGLSEKSLEVCTESLGSETGSDCFSISPEPELGYKIGGEENRVKETNWRDELSVPKYKESPARPFPPPIPSICDSGGGSFRIRSHRKSGRLVLEAVTVPPKNYFQARREDGRLILSLIDNQSEGESNEFEQVFDPMEEIDTAGERSVVTVEKTESPETKRNSEICNGIKEVESAKSLPPARIMAPAAVNGYGYTRWSKGGFSGGGGLLRNENPKEYGMGGCKEARRSISIWEPCCIATS